MTLSCSPRQEALSQARCRQLRKSKKPRERSGGSPLLSYFSFSLPPRIYIYLSSIRIYGRYRYRIGRIVCSYNFARAIQSLLQAAGNRNVIAPPREAGTVEWSREKSGSAEGVNARAPSPGSAEPYNPAVQTARCQQCGASFTQPPNQNCPLCGGQGKLEPP